MLPTSSQIITTSNLTSRNLSCNCRRIKRELYNYRQNCILNFLLSSNVICNNFYQNSNCFQSDVRKSLFPNATENRNSVEVRLSNCLEESPVSISSIKSSKLFSQSKSSSMCKLSCMEITNFNTNLKSRTNNYVIHSNEERTFLKSGELFSRKVLSLGSFSKNMWSNLLVFFTFLLAFSSVGEYTNVILFVL